MEYQRASKKRPYLDSQERVSLREETIWALLKGEISYGKALKFLRVKVLGVNQEQYAKMVKISRKTLSDIENERGNFTLEVLDQVFLPMGLKFAPQPISQHLMQLFLKE